MAAENRGANALPLKASINFRVAGSAIALRTVRRTIASSMRTYTRSALQIIFLTRRG
ncbi:MAG: hypothetical protein O4859_05315 [Trichodesmium sp. St18_bin1]|nr:hypothetical protein [Trichodesmium sp. St18_bin1]MDE5124349.1 hypothetical protein [Trichodesmium sp. St19_bin1]